MEALYEEVAYIAYHFHWKFEDILNLQHGDRHLMIEEISKINRRLTSGD